VVSLLWKSSKFIWPPFGIFGGSGEEFYCDSIVRVSLGDVDGSALGDRTTLGVVTRDPAAD
jgi:hypothetical protein